MFVSSAGCSGDLLVRRNSLSKIPGAESTHVIEGGKEIASGEGGVKKKYPPVPRLGERSSVV